MYGTKLNTNHETKILSSSKRTFTNTADCVQFLYRLCFTLKREFSDVGTACIFGYEEEGFIIRSVRCNEISQ